MRRPSDQPEWAEAASRGTTRDVTFPSCSLRGKSDHRAARVPPTRGAAHELPERSPPEGGGPCVGRGRPHASSICGRTCAHHSARLTGAGEHGRRPVAGGADSRCVRTSTAMLGSASELPRPYPGDQPGRLHVPGWHYTLDQHESAASRPFTQPAQRNAVADSPPHAQGLVAPMVLQLLASW